VSSISREHAEIIVNVKHAGKTYPVEVDMSAPGSAFKEAIYQVTGVPTGELLVHFKASELTIERMKVMVKGGMLKVRLDR
jgi:ubiquitin carboxyl-terminal hydrolase 14